MTNDTLKPPQDPPALPAWQEAKGKRRQQLAQVRNRRRLIYQLMRKMQLQANKQQCYTSRYSMYEIPS